MGAEDKGEQLRAAVDADPPRALVDALEPDHLDALAAKVTAAREHQREALARAGDDALRHVPKLLRGPLQRMLR
jgi:hypothetical protein